MSRKPPPPPIRRRRKGTALARKGLAAVPTVTRAKHRSMFVYLRNPGLALREVWEHFRMEDDDTAPYIRECIGWSTLERAANKQQWRARREEHWIDIQVRVLAKLKTQAVQREIDEIARLEVLMNSAQESTENAVPKSLEGLINAIINLDKRLAAKRDRIVTHAAAAGVDAETGEERRVIGPGTAVTDQFTDEEIERMAMDLARHRAGLIEESGHEAKE